MSAQQLLADAFRLRLEQFVETELNKAIDYRTGEILETRRYASQAYHPQPYPVLPTFTNLRSLPGLEQFLAHIDRRTLVLVNDCRRLYDLDKGRAYLHGHSIRFTTQQYRKLSRLVERLDYANTILCPPEALARHLRIERAHVHRYISQLRPLVRLYGARDGMGKGTLKVEVSPVYGFRYPKNDFYQARQLAIASWYRALMQ